MANQSVQSFLRCHQQLELHQTTRSPEGCFDQAVLFGTDMLISCSIKAASMQMDPVSMMRKASTSQHFRTSSSKTEGSLPELWQSCCKPAHTDEAERQSKHRHVQQKAHLICAVRMRCQAVKQTSKTTLRSESVLILLTLLESVSSSHQCEGCFCASHALGVLTGCVSAPQHHIPLCFLPAFCGGR